MTNVITRIATPPAWYPDPANESRLRYWDGLGWTTHHAANPVALVPVVDAATPSPDHVASGITEEDWLYEPMVGATRPTFQRTATATLVPTSTIAAWAYVLVPLLAVPFLLVTPDLTAASAWSVSGAALLGVMVIALGVLAALDHAQLRRRGVFNAPSALVGVLPLVFIIGRTARVGRSGAAVVTASLIVQAAVLVLLVWRVLPILA